MRSIVFALLMLVASSGWAYDDSGALVSGVGQNSCSDMTDETSKYPQAEDIYKQYIQGVVSAINLAVPGKNYLIGTDMTSRYKFVLKYCQDNPIDSVITGISNLFLKVDGAHIQKLLPPNTPCPPAPASKKKQK